MRLAAKHGDVTNMYCVMHCAESKTTDSVQQNESVGQINSNLFSHH